MLLNFDPGIFFKCTDIFEYFMQLSSTKPYLTLKTLSLLHEDFVRPFQLHVVYTMSLPI